MEVDAAIQDERAVNLISTQVETVEEGAGRLRWRLVGLFFCGRRRRRDVVDALFSCSVLICLLQCLRYRAV